ncbi:MAG: type II CAAX endopeptidase family protein [Acidobacteriota bacterium]
MTGADPSRPDPQPDRPADAAPPAPDRWPGRGMPLLPAGLRFALYFVIAFNLVHIGTLIAVDLLDPNFDLAALAEEARTAIEQGDDDAVDTLEQRMDPALALIGRILMLPALAFVTWLFLHVIDARRPASRIGLTLPDLRTGAWQTSIGLAALGLVAVLGPWLAIVAAVGDFVPAAYAADAIQIDAAAPDAAQPISLLQLPLVLLGLALSALIEEWMFRGYLYSTLRERFRWIHAAGMISVLYAFLHLGAPWATPAALTTIFLIQLLLAAVREATGSVLPGALLHGAWNAAIGTLLSLPVSGTVLFPLGTPLQAQGPDGLTGGSFGPEGSWLIAALLLPWLLLLTQRLGDRGPTAKPPAPDPRGDGVRPPHADG